MIEVRYSVDEAVDIQGTRDDIRELRKTVLVFLKTDAENIHINLNANIVAAPWRCVATDLEIVRNDGPVRISVNDEGVIRVEGSRENLERMT